MCAGILVYQTEYFCTGPSICMAFSGRDEFFGSRKANFKIKELFSDLENLRASSSLQLMQLVEQSRETFWQHESRILKISFFFYFENLPDADLWKKDSPDVELCIAWYGFTSTEKRLCIDVKASVLEKIEQGRRNEK